MIFFFYRHDTSHKGWRLFCRLTCYTIQWWWQTHLLKTTEIYVRLIICLFVSLWISAYNKPSPLWMTGIVQRPLFIGSVAETNETWSLRVCTISLTARLFYVCVWIYRCAEKLSFCFFPHIELWRWFTVEISPLYQILFTFCFMIRSLYGTKLLFVATEHRLILHYKQTMADGHYALP